MPFTLAHTNLAAWLSATASTSNATWSASTSCAQRSWRPARRAPHCHDQNSPVVIVHACPPPERRRHFESRRGHAATVHSLDRRRRRSRFAPADMVIVVDDEDRENEGDLTIAAESVTPEAMNFMATHGRGLGLSGDDAGAPRRARDSSRSRREHVAHAKRPFACRSMRKDGRRTGISAADRAATMLTAIMPETRPARSRAARTRVSAACARREACWFARGIPKRLSTWPGWPDLLRPASSAKS